MQSANALSNASQARLGQELHAVRLEFHDENARLVCIVGSFNDWNPKATPMLKTGPGLWLSELSLPAGIYEYQFVVDGTWINDPQAVKSTPRPCGGRNSVLIVERNNPVPPEPTIYKEPTKNK